MTVPPAQQCSWQECDNEAVDPLRDGALCEQCLHGDDTGGPNEADESADSGAAESIPQESDREPRRYSRVPAPLDELGEAFVPIDPGEKGTHRPRTPENLFAPDDPVLEAYLEAGHNYGVACRGDLAVVDADEPDALRDLADALPDTAWQVSGSRSSEHYFLQVPGLDEDLPLVDPETGDELGHIKAAGQSYVVGPGSRHPSGNRYGPLVGDAIATVDEDELRELLEPYRPDGADRDESDTAPVTRSGRGGGIVGSDLGLAVDDVL